MCFIFSESNLNLNVIFVEGIGYVMDLSSGAASTLTSPDDLLPASDLQLDVSKELERKYWLSTRTLTFIPFVLNVEGMIVTWSHNAMNVMIG